MHPIGSQIATFAAENPCEAVSAALASNGYIKPDSSRLAALGLGFPGGCHWTLTLPESVISITLTEDEPGRWRMGIRRDVPVRPTVVSRRTPSTNDERRATERVYRMARELHPVLRSVCKDLAWVRIGATDEAVTRPEPIPPDPRQG